MSKPAASVDRFVSSLSGQVPPGFGAAEQPAQAGSDTLARRPGARWHERLLAAADLVFETDAAGRFVFIGPDPVLGWPAAALLGQPGEILLLEDSRFGTGLNPFRPLSPMRNGRAWLRTSRGEPVCLSFAGAPLLDESGRVIGAGGTGIEVTEDERWQVAAASAMRRLDVLDHTLWRLRQAVTAPEMVHAALAALAAVIGADGAAIVQSPDGAGAFRHLVGQFSPAAQAATVDFGRRGLNQAITSRLQSGELLVCPCLTRFRPLELLALWRAGEGARTWTEEDCEVAGSAAGVLRVVLEQEAIQEELFNQSRTDPLTGLYNRGAFTDELARRIERLEREDLPGTLLIVDVDGLGAVNQHAGLEAGDAALCAVASLLRTTFRPADLLGRLGSDEFAAWLDGADDLAAAERAEALRVDGAARLAEIAGAYALPLSLSIGIGTRWPGRGEEIDALLHRVNRVVREVKATDRGQWRVSRPE
jgi:diguanylate cyclase (GGDEF)-like protein